MIEAPLTFLCDRRHVRLQAYDLSAKGLDRLGYTRQNLALTCANRFDTPQFSSNGWKQPGNKDIYKRLLKQCQNLHIPTLSSAEDFTSHYSSSTDLILDTIFGFSFRPPVRSPFDAVLRTMAGPPHGKDKRVPIVSIDIPSGWSVEDGAQKLQDEQGGDVPTFEPEVLLSLTCPKVGVKEFKGRHFLGGRFIPE